MTPNKSFFEKIRRLSKRIVKLHRETPHDDVNVLLDRIYVTLEEIYIGRRNYGRITRKPTDAQKMRVLQMWKQGFALKIIQHELGFSERKLRNVLTEFRLRRNSYTRRNYAKEPSRVVRNRQGQQDSQ